MGTCRDRKTAWPAYCRVIVQRMSGGEWGPASLAGGWGGNEGPLPPHALAYMLEGVLRGGPKARVLTPEQDEGPLP